MDSSIAGNLLKQALPDAMLEIVEFRGETTIAVDPGTIRKVMIFLRDNEKLQYDMLLDLAGTHFPERSSGFTIAYLLHSTKFNHRIRIRTDIAEGACADTVSDIWLAADWMEREAYDLLGITFQNHPNLKRILLPEDFSGHPLRKDFPVKGADFGQPVQVCLEEER